jgi:hypothetical protein
MVFILNSLLLSIFNFKRNNIMRKAILLLCILALYTASMQAQVQISNIKQPVRIGEAKNGPYSIAKLTYLVNETNSNDTTYTFSFRDSRFKDRMEYADISFKSDGNAKDDFYSIIKTVFSAENKRNKQYEVTFKLGKELVQVKNFRFTGITYAMLVFNGEAQTIPLLKSAVNKTFGKK